VIGLGIAARAGFIFRANRAAIRDISSRFETVHHCSFSSPSPLPTTRGKDRVLAVVNPGHPPTWSCWLTRRLVLLLLDNGMENFSPSTSTLGPARRPRKARRDGRSHSSAKRRLPNTAPAMSVTPHEVLKMTVAAAELVHQVTLTQQGERACGWSFAASPAAGRRRG